MDPLANSRRTAWWWVGAWAVMVATALATRPLLPVDETRYLAVAWEMWHGGDFLVPHLNGQIYAQKPPLLFWLFHLGWAVFGVNEWWPRLVPGLVALGCLALVARLGREIWPSDGRSAALAPALVAACGLWAFASTAVMFDMLIAFAALLAWIGGWRAWRGQRGGWWWIALGIGCGGLAKGPVILLVALPPLLLAPWWGAGLERRGGWYGRLALAVLGGVALALAWAVPAAIAGGAEYRNTIFVEQTQRRVFESFAHRRPFWWYLPLVPALLFPLALWPPLWRGLRAVWHGPRDGGVRFCLTATVPAFLGFCLISGKQPHYMLALLPPLGLLAARALGAERRSGGRRDLILVSGALGLVGAALVAVGWLRSPKLANWAAGHSPAVGLGLVAAAAGLTLWCRDGARGRPERLLAWTLALFAAIHLELAGPVGVAYDLGPAARRLAAIEREARPIAFAGEYHGQFHFLGRLDRPLAVIGTQDAGAWLAGHPRGCVVAPYRKAPPPGLGEPAFRQDYRGQNLGIWLAP
jgi:4-amino-4-deoxy-L-arabinose transferase-like glycosyltransferase